MRIARAIRYRRRQAGRLALLAGLPAAVVAMLAMAVAPASAATHPAHKPALHTPAPHKPLKPRKPAGHAPDDCGLIVLGSYTTTATTVPTGTGVTLTVNLSCDIGPTIYFVQIFDTTTDSLVWTCGAGTSCSTTVSQSAASTHGYVAYLDAYSSTFPPSTIYESENKTIYVTWETPPNNFAVSLSGPTFIGNGAGPGTYTAFVNQDVGPTPYWIEIFDETTGALLGYCGSGTSCSVSFTPRIQGDELVAFVSSLSSALPPAAAQASSNLWYTYQLANIQ